MYEWVNGKTFEVAEAPEDITKKREKITKRKEKAKEEIESGTKKPSKTNLAAAKKKLQKQLEGLELAETFVTDLLNRGVSSINGTSSSSYKQLAKQLGDYYLPELQAIMIEIITVAEDLSEQSDDKELNRLVSLCVRLSSSVKKSKEYITQTSHIKKWVRTLKNQYFNSQNSNYATHSTYDKALCMYFGSR